MYFTAIKKSQAPPLNKVMQILNKADVQVNLTLWVLQSDSCTFFLMNAHICNHCEELPLFTRTQLTQYIIVITFGWL